MLVLPQQSPGSGDTSILLVQIFVFYDVFLCVKFHEIMLCLFRWKTLLERKTDNILSPIKARKGGSAEKNLRGIGMLKSDFFISNVIFF